MRIMLHHSRWDPLLQSILVGLGLLTIRLPSLTRIRQVGTSTQFDSINHRFPFHAQPFQQGSFLSRTSAFRFKHAAKLQGQIR